MSQLPASWSSTTTAHNLTNLHRIGASTAMPQGKLLATGSATMLNILQAATTIGHPSQYDGGEEQTSCPNTADRLVNNRSRRSLRTPTDSYYRSSKSPWLSLLYHSMGIQRGLRYVRGLAGESEPDRIVCLDTLQLRLPV